MPVAGCRGGRLAAGARLVSRQPDFSTVPRPEPPVGPGSGLALALGVLAVGLVALAAWRAREPRPPRPSRAWREARRRDRAAGGAAAARSPPGARRPGAARQPRPPGAGRGGDRRGASARRAARAPGDRLQARDRDRDAGRDARAPPRGTACWSASSDRRSCARWRRGPRPEGARCAASCAPAGREARAGGAAGSLVSPCWPRGGGWLGLVAARPARAGRRTGRVRPARQERERLRSEIAGRGRRARRAGPQDAAAAASCAAPRPAPRDGGAARRGGGDRRLGRAGGVTARGQAERRGRDGGPAPGRRAAGRSRGGGPGRARRARAGRRCVRRRSRAIGSMQTRARAGRRGVGLVRSRSLAIGALAGGRVARRRAGRGARWRGPPAAREACRSRRPPAARARRPPRRRSASRRCATSSASPTTRRARVLARSTTPPEPPVAPVPAADRAPGPRLVGLVRRSERLVAALALEGEVVLAGPGSRRQASPSCPWATRRCASAAATAASRRWCCLARGLQRSALPACHAGGVSCYRPPHPPRGGPWLCGRSSADSFSSRRRKSACSVASIGPHGSDRPASIGS